MHVELAPELQQFVTEKVANGTYASSTEVVVAGIRLLKQHEATQRHLAELKTEISIGIEQAEKGDLVDGEHFMAQMMSHHEGRVKAGG